MTDQTMLTQQQLSFWDKNGYLVVEKVVPEWLMEKMNAYMDSLINGEIQLKDSPEGRTGTMQGHLYDSFIMKMSSFDPIPDMLADLLGGEAVICQSMYFTKGSQARIHQDEFFFRTNPPSTTGLWMALQDVTAEQGPLVVIPGSHKGPQIHAEDLSGRWWQDPKYRNELSDKTEEIADLSKLISVEMNAGDVLFFHGSTIHGGGPVASPDLERRSYVCHYHRADSVLDPSNNRVELPPVPLR